MFFSPQFTATPRQVVVSQWSRATVLREKTECQEAAFSRSEIRKSYNFYKQLALLISLSLFLFHRDATCRAIIARYLDGDYGNK